MDHEVRKMNVQWSSSHFCDEISEWLAENINGLDHRIKKMLSLIEQDGDVSMDKPQLISHIKEVSHTHHLLADRYNKLTEELRCHVWSATEMQNDEGNSPSLPTLDMKRGVQNGDGQEISLSSCGGISDFNEDSGSSSLSSDSDTESCNSSPNQFRGSLSSGKVQKHKTSNTETQNASDSEKIEGYEMLLERISKYEENLKISNEKLVLAEEEIAKFKRQVQNNEAKMVTMGCLEDELMSAKNKIKLHEADIEMENRKSLSLQSQIVDLESKCASEQRRVSELQESVGKYEEELTNSKIQIQKLVTELQDASESYALRMSDLESCASKLLEQLTFHKATAEELRAERDSSANQIKEMETLKDEMEREQKSMKITWETDIERMKAEICEKNVLVGSLNENLDGLKLKYDMLVIEKDEVNAKLQTFKVDLDECSNQIQVLECNLRDSCFHNEQLYAESENGKKLRDEMKSRIEELEEELGRQRMVISERGEEKRDAIRQLCVSIDYYRGAYEELRNAYAVHNRPNGCGLIDLMFVS